MKGPRFLILSLIMIHNEYSIFKVHKFHMQKENLLLVAQIGHIYNEVVNCLVKVSGVNMCQSEKQRHI
jgi:hypothetical protein